jgi:hypothetical protein
MVYLDFATGLGNIFARLWPPRSDDNAPGR